MKKNNIKIFIATHKKYKMPSSEIYVPIQVGKQGKQDLGYIGDNTGDNISLKNSNFCELTALYWAWKNVKDVDYIGLNHYRRYFTSSSKMEQIISKNKYELILNEIDIRRILDNYNIILPCKKHLFFENIRTNYKQQHYVKDLDRCGEILKKLHPEYSNIYDATMNSKNMYICNMFIMPFDLFNEYCEWLFPILFKLEKETDLTSYSVLQKRIYGFLSERLFNVWINYHEDLKIECLPILGMEHDSMKT